jgi:hypothetical protein
MGITHPQITLGFFFKCFARYWLLCVLFHSLVFFYMLQGELVCVSFVPFVFHM